MTLRDLLRRRRSCRRFHQQPLDETTLLELVERMAARTTDPTGAMEAM
jgi:hypothetical protein